MDSRNSNHNSKLAMTIIRIAPGLAPIASLLAQVVHVALGFLMVATPIYVIYSANIEDEPLDYQQVYREWLAVNYNTFDLGYRHNLAGHKVSFDGLDHFLNKGLFVKCMQVLSIKRFNADTIIVDGAIRFGQPKIMTSMIDYDGITLPTRSYFTYTNNKKRLTHKITRFTTPAGPNKEPYFPKKEQSASFAVDAGVLLPMQYGKGCDTNRYEMADGQSSNFLMIPYDETKNSLGLQSYYRPVYQTFEEKQLERAKRDEERSKNSLGDLFMIFVKKRFN